MDKVNNVLCGLKFKTLMVQSLEQGLAHNETTPTKKKDVQSHLCTRYNQREKGLVQDP
jgi:hypothetical protein